MVKNILSIDVEEIFHGEYTRQYRDQDLSYRTPHNIPFILKLLEDYDVRATFFVVGEIAEKYPEIIKMISEKGHEVAFHGWDHKPLWKLTPEKFRTELKAFKELYPDCMGFRAPSFSLNKKTKWVLKILCEEGFKYDSSIFPTWTPLYGICKAPLHPYNPSLNSPERHDETNTSLMEFPLAVYELLKLRIPLAGGFWLRFWDARLIVKGIKKINSKGFPAVIYIHNWELDPETPKLKLNPYKSFITYYNLNKIKSKFKNLLDNFQFTSFIDYIKNHRR